MPLGKTSETDLERIDLSTPGEWVDVKRVLGVDDERQRVSLMLAGQRLAPGQMLADFDAGAMYGVAQFATLEVAIKRWSVLDPSTGRVAALSPANIRALTDDDLALITARLDVLYTPPRSEAEAKNS